MDLILSVEAISHYRDVPGFVHEAHRVLRPNGVVVVLDSNNAINPRIRRANQIVWNAYEQGTSDGKLGGRELPKPFVERRREWIAEHYPELPAGELAEATYGYDFRDLETVLPDCPEPRSGAPVNPEDGAFLERMWNPFQLATEFREARFSTRVRGYWGGASGRSLIRFADRVLASTPLTMSLARGFRLAATRR
jgi:SAM-dependent methyltransferase